MDSPGSPRKRASPVTSFRCSMRKLGLRSVGAQGEIEQNTRLLRTGVVGNHVSREPASLRFSPHSSAPGVLYGGGSLRSGDGGNKRRDVV